MQKFFKFEDTFRLYHGPVSFVYESCNKYFLFTWKIYFSIDKVFSFHILPDSFEYVVCYS